jgi:hypothetical protein
MCTGVISFWVKKEGSRDDFSGAVLSTYDRVRFAKRKHESADTYHGDIGRQERNGGEKV